LYQSDMSARP